MAINPCHPLSIDVIVNQPNRNEKQKKLFKMGKIQQKYGQEEIDSTQNMFLLTKSRRLQCHLLPLYAIVMHLKRERNC